ncbi:DUF397 domain-containing protein [Actinophytocola algeriensis]|uniref:DUF397 domain-containing protein n=1 Tax=Actinophytocola algeriensis TaxID=1768010 RepID=A0A7W7QF94_9PSEU|nr:DUF397 domain-containing protein [Actinophytocola algeriensis]MBB4912520.1 hypothetical protein [Actinophytocola algeriensis]MBE1478894.1 hypothetical protein [Actinophytocola algeriensis]
MWRRSTRSGETGNCVELRGDLAAIRDSKSPQAILPIPEVATRKLLGFLRSRP